MVANFNGWVDVAGFCDVDFVFINWFIVDNILPQIHFKGLGDWINFDGNAVFTVRISLAGCLQHCRFYLFDEGIGVQTIFAAQRIQCFKKALSILCASIFKIQMLRIVLQT